MVLIAVPSRPTSVSSSVSDILAFRSPRAVMSLAVLAIRSSGPRPRPISHWPPAASRAISPPPVIISFRIRPRSCRPSAVSSSATNSTLGRSEEFSLAGISRAAAWSWNLVRPGGVTGNVRSRLISWATSGLVSPATQ